MCNNKLLYRINKEAATGSQMLLATTSKFSKTNNYKKSYNEKLGEKYAES
jgi:hypothetical protein